MYSLAIGPLLVSRFEASRLGDLDEVGSRGYIANSKQERVGDSLGILDNRKEFLRLPCWGYIEAAFLLLAMQ